MKFTDFQRILSPKGLTGTLWPVAMIPEKPCRCIGWISTCHKRCLHCSVVSRSLWETPLTENLLLGLEDWLRDSVANGGIFDIASCRDSARIITKAYNLPTETENTPIISFSLKWNSDAEVYVRQSAVQSHRANTSTDIPEQAPFISRDTIQQYLYVQWTWRHQYSSQPYSSSRAYMFCSPSASNRNRIYSQRLSEFTQTIPMDGYRQPFFTIWTWSCSTSLQPHQRHII